MQQPSVADRFKPKRKHTAPKAEQMTEAIAGFILRGMHSYSVVEELGFVALMNAAMPEYVVPSRTTFSRAIIPELFATKKQNLMNSLQAVIEGGVEAISITTDSWTLRANKSYLSANKKSKYCQAASKSVAHEDILKEHVSSTLNKNKATRVYQTSTKRPTEDDQEAVMNRDRKSKHLRMEARQRPHEEVLKE
ncbi:hypothetical protein HPB49_016119 [Dermacentor silvarum]|uniref:Uncharacterized protein n=1 Tax=Dermacentor silvarum TaxID=543639 RepID=A0ACB8CY88_DERSI|nr:hypothetical protein HPB49_016119 [Dermacentor silvarum]